MSRVTAGMHDHTEQPILNAVLVVTANSEMTA